MPKTLNKGQYRQSTLYDFSLVTRAVIYVYRYNNLVASSLSSVSGLKEEERLPVQINPSNYGRQKFNKGVDISSSNGVIDWESIADGSKKEKENSLSIPLIFDISDEYMVISNNGLIAYDVDIDSVTIINSLYKYSNPGYLCLFKWGPLNYLSRISHVNCNYEKFSPYGEPLRASVDLTLTKLELNNSTRFSDDDPSEIIGKSNWAVIKSRQKVDNAMVIAQKALEQSANETLPSIISSL